MSESGSGETQSGMFGLLQPVKEVIAVLSAALHTRLELSVLELEEEFERSKQLLARFLMLICGASFGFVLLNIFLVALFWQNGWIAAIGMLALVYFGVALYAGIGLKNAMRRPGGLFPATLAELAKDRDHLKASSRE